MNINKLKYKATDAVIVIGTIGILGVVGYFVASGLSALNKINLEDEDKQEEFWWN